MNRRDVLRSAPLLGVVSGCIGGGRSSGETRKRRVSIGESSGDLPESLRMNASMLISKITPEHTAIIEIELANEGSEPVDLVFGPRPPFSTITSDDGGWMLLLEPALEKKAPDCWEPPSDNELGNAAIAQPKTVPSGSALVERYELWGSPTDGQCMPTGKFTFSERYERLPSYSEFRWGLTIDVESISE